MLQNLLHFYLQRLALIPQMKPVLHSILNDILYLEISDNGKGIDDEIIHKVFEPYFSTKELKHGVGLGLYTSKIIVNMHLNGIITVKNNPKGATFKISLPVEKI